MLALSSSLCHFLTANFYGPLFLGSFKPGSFSWMFEFCLLLMEPGLYSRDFVFKVDIEGCNARIPGWRRWGIPSVSSSLSYGEIDTKLSKVVTVRT